MNKVPLNSYVYYALCELLDASDNLDSLLAHIEDDLSKEYISDVLKDVDTAISKLRNLAF